MRKEQVCPERFPVEMKQKYEKLGRHCFVEMKQ